jgi:hypothetical protein
MMQDGLSQVTQVTTTEAEKTAANKEGSVTFGLAGAVASLLKVDLSGKGGSLRESTTGRERSEERIHTPASLLFQLRHMLKEENRLHFVDSSYSPQPGHLVEFSSTLRRNPLIEAMDAMIGMLDIALTFAEQPKPVNKKQRGGDDEGRALKIQMEHFREKLTVGATVDIVSGTLSSRHTGILTLEEEFLSDRTMSNLVEGHFTVLGKVIRVVEGDGSISLLRKTALSTMPVPVLGEAFSHFSALSGEGGFSLPAIEWEVSGPAMQVLPIGIYA